MGAKEVYLTSVAKPVKWHGNSLICDFSFDAVTSAGRSPLYDTRFTLQLPKDKKDHVELIYMDDPHGEGG